MAKPQGRRGTKPKLGSGARFKTLKAKVGSAALAAHIGRKKYGDKKMQAMATAGRKKKNKPGAK